MRLWLRAPVDVTAAQLLVSPPRYSLQPGPPAPVNLSRTEFLQNTLRLGRHSRQQIFKLHRWDCSTLLVPNIGLPRSGLDEEMFAWRVTAHPLDVNAYRVRQLNAVLLPWGLVSSWLAGQTGLPSHIAAGGLGLAIAHELGHSLDRPGRGVDLQGRLAQVPTTPLVCLAAVRCVRCGTPPLLPGTTGGRPAWPAPTPPRPASPPTRARRSTSAWTGTRSVAWLALLTQYWCVGADV